MTIVYPLTPAMLALIAPLIYYLTDTAKTFVPASSRQNAIVRALSIAIGAAVALCSLPLLPGFAITYNALVGAAVQGGAIGGGVTLAVLAAYTIRTAPAAK